MPANDRQPAAGGSPSTLLHPSWSCTMQQRSCSVSPSLLKAWTLTNDPQTIEESGEPVLSHTSLCAARLFRHASCPESASRQCRHQRVTCRRHGLQAWPATVTSREAACRRA
eukprot:5611244-Prymnesium_polylepis.1